MNYDPIHDNVTQVNGSNATTNDESTIDPPQPTQPAPLHDNHKANINHDDAVSSHQPSSPPSQLPSSPQSLVINPMPMPHVVPNAMAHLMSDDITGQRQGVNDGVMLTSQPDDLEPEGENDSDKDNDNDHDQEFNDNDNDNDMEGDDINGANVTKKSKTKRPVSASIPKGVRYLKKSDGEPFWRKDIQYDFLEALFENDQRVFTNLFPYCTVPGFYGGPKYTFAELYVRTLAELSKCSKILKERLLKDFDMGKSVAKVCLLVNTGRMNTTINFVPEMRSTLRTYHSIPSLQADATTGTTKPLQDTPRLKSILKAVSDTNENFKTIEDLLENPPSHKPNTNLVLLLFLLSNNMNGIKYHHLHDGTCHHISNSFMEFFLETKIHPLNRAKRFLWLMYTYLETNFKEEELIDNPFGGAKMPDIELVRDEDLNNFDKDTDYEIEYSEKMFRTRLKYLADEEHNSNPKRGNKPKKDDNTGANNTVKTNHGTEETDHDGMMVDTTKIGKEIDDDNTKRKLLVEEKNEKKKKKLKVSSTNKTNNHNNINNNIHDNGEPDKNTEEEEFIDLDFNHVKFPLLPINKIISLNKASETPVREPDFSLSQEYSNNVNKNTQNILQSTSVKPSDLNKGTEILRDWILKFFQYRKLIGNGLVSMGWEEIRYDLMHGIEEYLNKSKGEELIKLGTIPEANYEFKLEYEPKYDFELINEKTQYLLNLLNGSKAWIVSKYQEFKTENIKPSKISFDLEHEKLIID